jgi:AraC-like DNA-binding protein
MRQCADLPRRQTCLPAKGGRYGDETRMTSTALSVRHSSYPPTPEGRGYLERPGRSRSDHRPVLAPWQVSLAQTFMLEQLAKSLHVPELAGMCRLSPTYFVRAFANTVGVAPYAWFLGRRVARARFLLANSELPLAQIALECGFSDQAHFTNAFGRATGTTPARWRKAQLRPSGYRE